MIIGEPSVGKTTLLEAYSGKEITLNSRQPTIGADFVKRKATLADGKTEVSLQLWDTAGQERFQSLCVTFYRGADCCFLVYDITNQQTLDNISNWKDSFLQKSMVV